VAVRRLLRALGEVALWHVEEPRKPGQKGPVVRYEVIVGRADPRRFDRPQEAWRHFQQLTHAPDKDTRPDPPPIDAPPPDPSRPRRLRRRRRKAS
jgi:hypothetical protein